MNVVRELDAFREERSRDLKKRRRTSDVANDDAVNSRPRVGCHEAERQRQGDVAVGDVSNGDDGRAELRNRGDHNVVAAHFAVFRTDVESVGKRKEVSIIIMIIVIMF